MFFAKLFTLGNIFLYFIPNGRKIKILCAPWKVCEEKKEERELLPNPSISPSIDGDWCQPRRNERSAERYIKKRGGAPGLLLCTGIQLSRWIVSFYSVIFHNLSSPTCSKGRPAAFLGSNNTDRRWGPGISMTQTWRNVNTDLSFENCSRPATCYVVG